MRRRSPRERARTRQAFAAAMEPLSPRILLSAKLIGSTLKIVGTDAADMVAVSVDPRFINMLAVTLNGEVKDVSLSAVGRIDIRTFGGDDKVWIDPSLDPMGYRSFIDGGSGNDSITSGAGRDTVLGGDGNDKIYTNAGNDSIDGGAGKDTLSGGAGDDIILAGSGNDRVDGGDGNDFLTNTSGVDSIFAGAGNDSGRTRGGSVDCGDGNDVFVGLGQTTLLGDAGDDNLQASDAQGGDGNDTLSGLLGNDTLWGDGGNDLIRGFSGSDLLYGGDGDDAIFGGADTDTLSGGPGNDNLYGTDGFYDKHKDQGGSDDATGDDGSDWFETNYRWNNTDRDSVIDRPVNTQNALTQDPSAGRYTTGAFIAQNNLGQGSVDMTSGLWFEDGIATGKNPTNSPFGGGVPVVVELPPTVVTTPITTVNGTGTGKGNAGWVSSGSYDTTAQKFVPPTLTHKERISIERAILQLPAGWQIGDMSFARDGIVWYSISRAGDLASFKASYQPSDSLKTNVGAVTSGNSATSTGTTASSFSVPTLDGGSTTLPDTTPHLLDGVDNGAYRFVGIRAGSILINGAGSVVEPNQFELNATLLPVPMGATLRIAGGETTWSALTSTDGNTLPKGASESLKGILVEGGAIWLPTDGTAPYFSAATH